MPADVPPVPAEQEALDRPWRLWASVAVVTFVLVSVILGFLALPESEEEGFDPWTAICRAIGVPGYGPQPPAAAAAAAKPPSQFAWTSAARSLLAGGDAKRGATPAAEVCVACHGEAGIAVDPAFPNLANQSAAALLKQLRDYKTGNRLGGQAAVMQPLVEPLTDQQMADVAAFYGAQKPQARVRAASAVLLPVERLATMGDPARGIAACETCHGTGRGGPEESPVLLGQSAAYVEQQLQLFASGERNNDLFARMRVIASQLTPDEMRALGIYYGGLAVPKYKP